MANKTAKKAMKFFKKFMLVRFGVPKMVVTDNRTELADKKF